MYDPRTKSFECTWKDAAGAAGGVTEGELALINRYALRALSASEVYVRTMALCNTRYDRSQERFPEAYLQRFRNTLPGKSLLPNHDKRAALPLGKFFRAELQTAEDGERELVVSFYMLKTPANQELRDQIDAGVVSHCSIGFRWGDLLCDLCGISYYGATRNDATGERVWCPHVLGERYDGRLCTATYGGELQRVEAVEASLVYLGCQYGAEITKAVIPEEGDPAEAKERVRTRYFARDGSSAGRETGAEEVPMIEEKAPSVLALEKRCQELEAAISEVEPLVADGRLYREDLKAEIRRLAGIVQAEKEAGLILKAAEKFDCTQLKALVREYDARAEKLFPPQSLGTPAQPRDAAPEQPVASRRPLGGYSAL